MSKSFERSVKFSFFPDRASRKHFYRVMCMDRRDTCEICGHTDHRKKFDYGEIPSNGQIGTICKNVRLCKKKIEYSAIKS